MLRIARSYMVSSQITLVFLVLRVRMDGFRHTIERQSSDGCDDVEAAHCSFTQRTRRRSAFAAARGDGAAFCHITLDTC